MASSLPPFVDASTTIPRPTWQHAPCDGDPTRTTTPTSTATPTLDLRSPTPSDTSTHFPLFHPIALEWPPNCAVLHSHALPAFKFGAMSYGPFIVTLDLNGPVSRVISRVTMPMATPYTPDFLPDGEYYWFVTSMKFENVAGESEVWTFRIDTTCGCTDTPTSTPNVTTTPSLTTTPSPTKTPGA
jgi:hypothetical protein